MNENRTVDCIVMTTMGAKYQTAIDNYNPVEIETLLKDETQQWIHIGEVVIQRTYVLSVVPQGAEVTGNGIN